MGTFPAPVYHDCAKDLQALGLYSSKVERDVLANERLALHKVGHWYLNYPNSKQQLVRNVEWTRIWGVRGGVVMNWGPFFVCFHEIIVIFGWDNAMLRELGWDEKGRKGSGELLGVGNVSTERCNEAGTWEGALRGRGWRGVVYIKLSLLCIWAAFHVRMMSSKWGL